MILIDLQEAFDGIDQDILLQILHAIGFSKHSENCFQSYLIKRTFLVNWEMHFLSMHVCPVVYRKDLFLALYSLSYILMMCDKLSNVIFFFMLMIHAFSVNIKILMKLKNN